MDKTHSAISQDAQRHEETVRHHGERTKSDLSDRRDGTGRGHEAEKKGGAGKGNWGSLADESAVRAEEEEGDAGPDQVAPQDFVENEEVLTLDEYEKLKQKA